MTLPPTSPSLPRISTSANAEIEHRLHGLIDWLVSRYSGGSKSLDILAPLGKKQKPFMYGLFPAVVRASEIERSISTKLGEVMQECAKSIAIGAGFESETEYTVAGTISQSALDHIRQLVRRGRASESGAAPDVAGEMQTINGLLATGGLFPHSVKMDLFVADRGDEYYFDLKTPSPNSDQPRDMKDRLMQARTLRRGHNVQAYAVFYYNPKGTLGSYTQGQSYLDYAKGEVLVGRDFWDFLAGSGTYEELLDIFSSVGAARLSDLQGIL